VILCMTPAILQAGWGWGNKDKDEKEVLPVESKQEDPKLRQTFKEKTPEEKQAEIQQHRDARLAENKAIQQAIRDKQMAELKINWRRNEADRGSEKRDSCRSGKQY